MNKLIIIARALSVIGLVFAGALLGRDLLRGEFA